MNNLRFGSLLLTVALATTESSATSFCSRKQQIAFVGSTIEQEKTQRTGKTELYNLKRFETGTKVLGWLNGPYVLPEPEGGTEIPCILGGTPRDTRMKKMELNDFDLEEWKDYEDDEDIDEEDMDEVFNFWVESVVPARMLIRYLDEWNEKFSNNPFFDIFQSEHGEFTPSTQHMINEYAITEAVAEIMKSVIPAYGLVLQKEEDDQHGFKMQEESLEYAHTIDYGMKIPFTARFNATFAENYAELLQK